MAADSAGPSDSAQRGADCIKQASTAGGFTGSQSQMFQNRGVETSASSNPRVPVYRVRKSGTCQTKAPKTVTACENCRSVMSFTTSMDCKYIDIEAKYRHARLKCPGEVPSCGRCLRKGQQCGGYSAAKKMKTRRRAAAIRGSINNPPADAPLPHHEDQLPQYQASVPQNNAWNVRGDEGLQQNVTTNRTGLTDNVGTDPMASQRNYLLHLFDYLDNPPNAEQD